MSEDTDLYSKIITVRCRKCAGKLESTGSGSERQHTWKSYICNMCNEGGVIYIDLPSEDARIATTGVVKLADY
jgi:hypothetical protein